MDFGLWSCGFRGNVIVYRAHNAIQVEDCRPRRRSWSRFPLTRSYPEPCELRGLCCRSYFGPRTCGRGITNIPKCAGISIRVSPSHPYNAGRAGLGWGGVGWLLGNVYAACSGCVVFLWLTRSGESFQGYTRFLRWTSSNSTVY